MLATRLVVRYFREHGHKPLDQIVGRHKHLLTGGVNRPRARDVTTSVGVGGHGEVGGREPSVVGRGEIGRGGLSKAGDGDGENFRDLIVYLKNHYRGREEMSEVPWRSVTLLSSQGITAGQLITAFSSGPSLDWLISKLSPLRRNCSRVDVFALAKTIMDWTTTKKRGGVRKELRHVHHSLLAFRQFVVKYLPGALAQSGQSSQLAARQTERLAEEYHKSLTNLGFSHFHLKNEFDKGESVFQLKLRRHLRENPEEVSSDVSVDILVSLAVRYFRVNF